MKKLLVLFAFFSLFGLVLFAQQGIGANNTCTSTATCPDGSTIRCSATGADRSCSYSNGCVTCTATDPNGISSTSTDCCDGFEPVEGDIATLE